MRITLEAIEAEIMTLEAIEAELTLIRLQYRGYTVVGRQAMNGRRKATASEMIDLRRALARYEVLLRAANYHRTLR